MEYTDIMYLGFSIVISIEKTIIIVDKYSIISCGLFCLLVLDLRQNGQIKKFDSLYIYVFDT